MADPWRLLGTRVVWAELAQWLLLRGCTSSSGSMEAWGMKDGRPRRIVCFPFG